MQKFRNREKKCRKRNHKCGFIYDIDGICNKTPYTEVLSTFGQCLLRDGKIKK